MDRARISAHWVSCLSFGSMGVGGWKSKNGVLFIRNGNHEFSQTPPAHEYAQKYILYLFTHYIHCTHTQPSSDTNTCIPMYIKYTPRFRMFRSFRYEIRRTHYIHLYKHIYQTATATWNQDDLPNVRYYTGWSRRLPVESTYVVCACERVVGIGRLWVRVEDRERPEGWQGEISRSRSRKI